MSNEVKDYLKNEFLNELDDIIGKANQCLENINQSKNFEINIDILKKQIKLAQGGCQVHELDSLFEFFHYLDTLLTDQKCSSFNHYQTEYLINSLQQIPSLIELDELEGDFVKLTVEDFEKLNPSFDKIQTKDKKGEQQDDILDEEDNPQWRIYTLFQDDVDIDEYFCDFNVVNHAVTNFKNLTKLLKLAEKKKPHIILIGKSGVNIDKIQLIKNIDQEIPIILVSSEFSLLEVLESINFGVNNFLKYTSYPNIVFGVCQDLIEKEILKKRFEREFSQVLYLTEQISKKVSHEEFSKLSAKLKNIMDIKAQVHTQASKYKRWKKGA
ncbi:MAG: hypothetical protein OEY33_03560 [Bdellovibrionales bacterium]|nr:hypothetical protein [Bdellovibrionales bacterium]